MPVFRTDRNQTFDIQGNLLSEEVVDIDVTEEAVTYDLHTKARQAVADNITAIGNVQTGIDMVQTVLDGTATNLTQANAHLDQLATVTKQLLQDYERVLRQLVAMQRLLIGSDLLQDTAGT